MSTASKPTEHRTGKYAKFDEYVDFQITKTSSNIKANDLLTTAVGISTIFLGYLLLFVVFDHWFIKGGFGHFSRLCMLLGVTLACFGWAIWKLVIPYFKKVTKLYSAHALEQSSDDMEGSLLNLIDLKKSDRPVNPSIISSLEKRAALRLSKSDTDLAVDRGPLMRLSYCLLGVVILLCVYALFSPKEIWPSISAAMSFASERDFATQTEITSVSPGNTEVLSGSQLEVTVDLRGEVPEKVMLFFTSNDQGRVNEPVTLRAIDETSKRYQGLIVGVNGRGIRQELSYHIEAGDAVSENFQVKVIQPPSATIHSVRYDYPQYMGLSPVDQPGGAIDAWEGTTVTVNATTNMPITSFEVLFSDEEKSSSLLEEFKIEKTIQKNSITATWKLKLRADRSFPKYYQIKCRNEAGQTTLSPTVYPLMIRPDLPPEITLLSPKQDLKIPSNGTVPISVAAEDPDFKLRYLTLKVDKEQKPILDQTLFEGSKKSVGLTHDFKLEPLRLTPGDTIYFWVEARDNKRPSGNRKNTPKIKIEILKPVSKAEAQKQLQEQKQKAAEENRNPNPEQNNPSKNQGDNKTESGNDESKPNPDQTKKDKNKESENKSDSGSKKGNQSENSKGENQSEKNGNQEPTPSDSQKNNNSNPEQNGAKSDEKKSLDSSGKDDQEAIKKILEQLKKEGKEPESDSKEKQNDSQNQDSQKQGSDQNKQNQKSSNPSDKPGESPSKSSGGTPSDTKNNNKNASPKPSSKGNQPANDPAKQKQNKNGGNIPKGKEEPADPSDDAVKRKSDGNSKGKATPNHDPNADPQKSNKDVQRDPKDKPATRPGKKNSPDSKPNQNSEPGKKNSSNKSGTSTENKPQKGMRKPENSNQNPSPSNQNKPSTEEKSKSKDNQPDGSNESPKGENKPTEQKSKRPQDGETGKSSQNDQGQSGSKQPGKGDSTGQKGNQEQGSQEKSSDSKQSMNQNKGQGEKSSGNSKSEGGKQGANSKSSSKGNSKGNSKGGKGAGGSKGEGESKPGKGSASGPSSENPKGGGNSSTTGSGMASSNKNTSGSESGLPEAEDANLEYGKEAANLVLKRIKDELKRKEVNQELLKELGWTKEQMKQFSERLQKQLQTPDTDQQSLESLAKKRQFEEMLKSLKPASSAARRKRTSTRKQTNDSLGPRRLPVPEEYREAYEAFTRGLAEQKTSGN